MSVVNEFEFAAQKIEDFLGLSVGLDLGNNRVLFRDVNTGRYAFSADIWTYFRENYEELKGAGAF